MEPARSEFIVRSSGAARPWTPSELRLGRLAGLGLLVLFAVWEIARPALPVSFELAAAARAPGTATWVGRLPPALLALVGLMALYTFVARTIERRAATYAVAITATMPAWFVHGRLMTGAMVPMACAAVVLAGLGVAIVDPRAGRAARALGVLAAAAAAVGSLVAVRWGIPGRGLVPVALVPLVAVLVASLLLGPPRAVRSRAVATQLAVLALALGAVGYALAFPDGAFATALLGARTPGARAPSTFDAPVVALAYGLVPWTPLLPFALARRPTSAAHLALMLAAGLGIVAHSLLGPRALPSTFVSVAALAASVALLLRTLEDARRPAVTLIASVLAIGSMVAHDFGVTPERALVAFGASDAALPAAHAAASALALRSSIWLCTVLTCFALAAPRSWLPVGRGLAIVAGGVLAGLVLRVHAYPELLMRLSPGVAFDAWATHHREGEPLGIVGLDPRTLAFAPGTAVAPQKGPRSAGVWLAAPAPSSAPARRFLALAAPELPQVNAAFREIRGSNVPVLAGQGGETLLAATHLNEGERSESPLDGIVLGVPPTVQHAASVTLDDRLESLGWELTDDRGARLDAVPSGSRHAHLRFFWRPRTPGSGHPALTGLCTFLHVDHAPSRFSAEHREQTYPMALWRNGDVVVDDYDLELPSHFRAGSYRIYYGVGLLPCEDDRRLHITNGPNDGHDRIVGGTLEVR